MTSRSFIAGYELGYEEQSERVTALESELATAKQTVAELQSRVVAEQQAKNFQAARIAELEGELETAAVALQSALPIGQVKAIGLREVAAGVGQLTAELSALRQRCERAEGIVEAAERAYFPVVVSGAVPDGISTIDIDEWNSRQAAFFKLLAASREGGAR